MGEIILQADENELNAALVDSLQSAVGNISGTRLDRILVVGTSSAIGSNGDATSIPVEEIELSLPLEFDKYISVDASQISKVCRICLCEKSDMHPLFETWEVETIAEMLTSFAAVQLSFGDGLPESVCGECTELVGKCFAFKQLCERSETMLRCLVTQGHLQGMKQEPSLETTNERTSDSPDDSKRDVSNRINSFENKEEPPDYEEFLDDDFQRSTSPFLSNVTTDCTSARKMFQNASKRNNKSSMRKLSIINNPAITINPASRLRKEVRREKHRRYSVRSLDINNSSKDRSRPLRTLANLSRKYKDVVKRKYEIDEAVSYDGRFSPLGDDLLMPKNNSEPHKYQCSSCGKSFSDQRKLRRHEKIHLAVKPFHCTVCRKGFSESGDLTKHSRRHDRDTVKNKQMNLVDVDSDRLPCENCHLTFSSEGDLRIHSSIHLVDQGMIKCNHCKKDFHSSLQLKRHVRIHLSDKPHKCRVCHKGFPEMGSLTRHFRRHTGETREKKHVCSICGKSYYDRHSLRIHERTHTGEKPWICSKCGKGFIDSRLLNSHMKTHSDTKPYACKTCDRKFKHESTLTTHIRTHTGEKPYICSVCGNAFVQSSNLSLHMRTHTREKPYSCEFCSKKFSSSSALTTHTRIHTGEKPYFCKICDKRFARHDMTTHMRTHTGEKPYVCSVCHKKFTTPGQLHQHTRIHTGERPFICGICNKGCATSSYLKKHMSKSHNAVTIQPAAPVISSPIEVPKVEKIDLTDCDLEPNDNVSLPPEQVISSGHVINVANTLTLTSNTLNVVAVENANGELSITTANALNVATLTAQRHLSSDSDTPGAIVTNTHFVSQEKLYQIRRNLLRIRRVPVSNVIQPAIAEFEEENT